MSVAIIRHLKFPLLPGYVSRLRLYDAEKALGAVDSILNLDGHSRLALGLFICT